MQLIINSDLRCEVYIDTEFYGAAEENKDYKIALLKGAYWVQCISCENREDCIDFDFRAEQSCGYYRCEISLKQVRFQRRTAQYDSVGEFRYGVAEVKKDGEIAGYINPDGNLICKRIHPLGENFCCIEYGGRKGLLNLEGKMVCPIDYDDFELIPLGIIACREDKYRLFNLDGELYRLFECDEFQLIRYNSDSGLVRCLVEGEIYLLLAPSETTMRYEPRGFYSHIHHLEDGYTFVMRLCGGGRTVGNGG